MEYKDILKAIRLQEPDLSFADAQKKASAKLKELKAAQEEFNKSKDPVKIGTVSKTELSKTPVTTSVPKKEKPEGLIEPIAKENLIALSTLMKAEKQIRTTGINRNSIVKIGSEIMPFGELVMHEKVGVNTNVTFEDKFGNRIPINGFFKIFIIR